MIVGEQIITDSNGNQKVFKMIQTEGANRMHDIKQTTHDLEQVVMEANPWKESPPVSCSVSYSLLCDVLSLLKEQSEYKSCSNCSMSKLQAARGTGGCYYYRCKKHRIWGKYGFYCSDWAKRGERE